MDALLFQLKIFAGLDDLLVSEKFSHLDLQSLELVLEQAQRFSEQTLTALATKGDRDGCSLKQGRVILPAGTTEAWQTWCELGFPLTAVEPARNGLGFPLSLQCAIQEICDAANLAFGMLAINQRCAICALTHASLDHNAQRQVDEWLPLLNTGEITSTIAISEPQAGSDVGRILTAAKPLEDGSWSVSGTKIWISYGDHDATKQILHLLLARIPDGGPGTRGLGLFAVPKLLDESSLQTNGISVQRLEEKMGLHASPTCVLELKEAKGWLIGEAGKGLQALFTMMNGMRLAVAVQGSAVANRATEIAVAYANERLQGGDSSQPPLPISRHADVRRMLLEMTAASELARALTLRTAALLDLASASTGDAAGQLQRLAELLLPLAKTIGAETGFEVANTGIQVLGGYGYSSEYPLDRMARDIRIASIYEGTSGIQALDFLKRKVLKDEGRTLHDLIEIIRKDLSKGTSPFMEPVTEIFTLHAKTTDYFVSGASGDEGACAYLQLSALLMHCWNGHTLWQKLDPVEITQQRLQAALQYYAAGLQAKASYWHARCNSPLPDCTFGD